MMANLQQICSLAIPNASGEGKHGLKILAQLRRCGLRQGTLGRTWVSGPAHKFSVFGPTVMYYIYSLHTYLLKYTLLNYHILNYDVCSGAACDINAEMCPDGIG